MKKTFWAKKAIMVLLFASIFLAGFSFIIMSLWNNVLVSVVSVHAISFWQALGIFALCKILFGGFPAGRFGWKNAGNRWGRDMHGMREKWMSMSDEEREKFKQDWKTRCGGRSREKEATKSE
jgi:Ca2+/H+ antiporter, TMEM165/GDT1 family